MLKTSYSLDTIDDLDEMFNQVEQAGQILHKQQQRESLCDEKKYTSLQFNPVHIRFKFSEREPSGMLLPDIT